MPKKDDKPAMELNKASKVAFVPKSSPDENRLIGLGSTVPGRGLSTPSDYLFYELETGHKIEIVG